MAFYGDISEAAELAGVNESDATQVKQDSINTFIDTNIRWEGFQKKVVDEYYDIYKNNQDEIVLRNFPVVSVIELYDEANTDDPKLIESDNYVSDKESGIIQLVYKKTISTNKISEFSKGHNSVRVKYEYGFETVSEPVQRYATLLLARYLTLEIMAGKTGILKSFKAGNYSETSETKWKTPYDNQLMILEKNLKAYYACGV